MMRESSFCATGERQLAAYLEKRLSVRESESFAAHVEGCETCKGEIELWEKLGKLPAAMPSAYFRQDFEVMLTREAKALRSAELSGEGISKGVWWKQPALGWAAAAIFAIGGFFSGTFLGGVKPKSEMGELREELRSMRSMMAMSLLRQQSAVERLRGVNYSVRLDNPDDEVVGALLQTLRGDSSVDVRLAATDALRKYSSRPKVRQAMVEALPMQDSPLMQLALIDVMVEFRERRATPNFEKLARQESIDPTVKLRLDQAIEELKVQ